MEKQLILSKKFSYLATAMILIGAIAIIVGFFINPQKTWANLLVNNYYFLTLALGGTFFWALQYITNAGWTSGFLRVPMAMGNFIPVAALLMIPILFGLNHLYEWSHPMALEDPIIAHKHPFLNIPFFVIRFVVYFVVWISLTQVLRRLSLKEDEHDGLNYFKKSSYYSRIYIFALAFSFSLASFDWIMSIDVHWFSTIFAVRNFVMAFYHGTVVTTLIVIILNKLGYLPFLTKSHLKGLSKYIFVLGIIWVYTWFAQYILIWYANIPEETIYYMPRTKGEFVPLFYLELIINWFIPFMLLMSGRIVTSKNAMIAICSMLVIGQWIDVYNQVFPGAYHHLHIGFIDVGTFVGFLGIFGYLVARFLTMVPLVPKHHPLLDESLEYQL